MCPTDLVQADAIAEMLETWGIEAVTVIQRVDPWADGIYNLLLAELDERGIITQDDWRISYNPESKEFASDLQTLEGIAQDLVAEYGAERSGILVIGFSEVAIIFTQAEAYDTIYNQVRWFGTDGTAITQKIRDDAPVQAAHVQVPSTLASPAISAKYRELNATYFPLVGQVLSYYSACTYDISWILTQGVLETQGLDASEIIPFIPTISQNHYGASGWNRLNSDGDRFAPDYEIWGYGVTGTDADGNPVTDHVKYGQYDTFFGTVEWYTERIGFIPPGLKD
jgi:ABC-type branched-subunit amino acid transport system substrate-binding protein